MYTLSECCYNNIYNCYVTGSIDVTGNLYIPIGGICGVLDGKANIENCYNLANVNCLNTQEEAGMANIGCGGIVGQIEGEEVNINKCFNKGTINLDGRISSITVGGIVGSPTVNKGSIKNCYNDASIKGKSQATRYTNIGGIIGILYPNMELTNCYNSGEISGNTNALNIGGIAGSQWTNSSINNVYNTGEIIINSQGDLYAGGISGHISSGTNSIDNAYNTGILDIQNASNIENVGSIVGNLAQITLSNCYYLKDTYDVGVGGSETVTGVAEWDSLDKFPSVLEVMNLGEDRAFKEDTNNINNGYPILNWQ